MILERVKRVPVPLWVAMAVCAGLLFLIWHQYANDDQDGDWTRPKELQAPENAAIPMDHQHQGNCCDRGRAMAVHGAFRARAYAPTLVDLSTSLIGEV